MNRHRHSIKDTAEADEDCSLPMLPPVSALTHITDIIQIVLSFVGMPTMATLRSVSSSWNFAAIEMPEMHRRQEKMSQKVEAAVLEAEKSAGRILWCFLYVMFCGLTVTVPSLWGMYAAEDRVWRHTGYACSVLCWLFLLVKPVIVLLRAKGKPGNSLYAMLLASYVVGQFAIGVPLYLTLGSWTEHATAASRPPWEPECRPWQPIDPALEYPAVVRLHRPELWKVVNNASQTPYFGEVDSGAAIPLWFSGYGGTVYPEECGFGYRALDFQPQLRVVSRDWPNNAMQSRSRATLDVMTVYMQYGRFGTRLHHNDTHPPIVLDELDTHSQKMEASETIVTSLLWAWLVVFLISGVILLGRETLTSTKVLRRLKDL